MLTMPTVLYYACPPGREHFMRDTIQEKMSNAMIKQKGKQKNGCNKKPWIISTNPTIFISIIPAPNGLPTT
jgi:hypothetical protein